MSPPLIGRSDDLSRLRDDGYDLEIVGGHLCVKDVPYLTSNREVKRGTLVVALDLAGDVTVAPTTHVAFFAGELPCRLDGQAIKAVNGSSTQDLGGGVVVNHSLSSRPQSGTYPDYYRKVTSYVHLIAGPAQAADAAADARTFPVVADDVEESVFRYVDTASSRAGIGAITEKLRGHTISIVGAGGTGSYILDFVAKTPVSEIHLWDGDRFLQHNAFRSPGAVASGELGERRFKTDHFAAVYDRMRRGVISHPEYVTEDNVAEVAQASFVFVAIDDGDSKRLLVDQLVASATPFVDVGMGVYEADGQLYGQLRTTTSTSSHHNPARISFATADAANEYSRNIQIADLNALNAALAVIRWKQLMGFYGDQEHAYYSVYVTGGNLIINDDLNS